MKVEFALDTVRHSGKAVTVINYLAVKAYGEIGSVTVCILNHVTR